MGKIYIATKKSKELIKNGNNAERKGERVDWDEIFKQVDEVSAKGIDQQIKAIGKKI